MTDHTTNAKNRAAAAAAEMADLKAMHEANVAAVSDLDDLIAADLLPHMQTLYAERAGALAEKLAATFYETEPEVGMNQNETIRKAFVELAGTMQTIAMSPRFKPADRINAAYAVMHMIDRAYEEPVGTETQEPEGGQNDG